MKSRKINSVFLCRSPLQARICMGIIKKYNVTEFDVIYSTYEDSDTDQAYFSQLSAKAKYSLCLSISKKNKDIVNHIQAIIELKKRWPLTSYDDIYIGSIDSYLFRFVIKKSPKAILLGFDDGAANITPDGHYFNLGKYKRANMYSKILGLPTPEKIRLKLAKHYSIYPNFINIVQADKISYLSVFSDLQRKTNDKVSIYFIGQPFHEYLNSKQVNLLKAWLETQSIHYYVMHPREKSPLLSKIPLLEKEGMLAEDAIFKSAGNSRVRIISAYSTVLFNINCKDAEKFYLSLSDDEVELRRRILIEKTGSEIIVI